MCDNLDVEGKERCGLEGQGLNTGSESCEPARDSWSPTLITRTSTLHKYLVTTGFEIINTDKFKQRLFDNPA
jgi:hypothetical protein